MSPPIISVEGLSKSYLVGHHAAGRGERYTALRDVLARNAKQFLRTTRDMLRGRQIIQGDEVEEFWALNEVSFEVNEGEVVGIIGRNGSGKSTLLKILSRITEPTEGRVVLRGRVASLLEVGTGFHPELTGRENIFLNGAILGMTRAEINRKFEEIVAFAEVERFLDTPVKRYSSGMYVRLAFAVAAHLDPEILLIDEVLAVGDAEFQKKCLGKMRQVAALGRTVLFVSHNMGAIRALCNRGALLAEGRLAFIGRVGEAVAKYASATSCNGTDFEIREQHHRIGQRNAELTAISVQRPGGEANCQFLIGEDFELSLNYRARRDTCCTAWILISDREGTVLCCSFMKDDNSPVRLNSRGQFIARASGINLLPGTYYISAGLFSSQNDIEDWCEHVANLEILPQFSDGRSFDNRLGHINYAMLWRHKC